MNFKIVIVSLVLFSSLFALELKDIQEMCGKVLPGTVKVAEMKYKESVYYAAYDDSDKLTGNIFVATVKGYHGPIRIIAGFDKEGKVVNYLLNHNETKEYFDLIKKSDFKDRCKGKTKEELSMKSADNKKGKIDGVTGATVTCQAIVDGLKEAAELFEKTQKKESAAVK